MNPDEIQIGIQGRGLGRTVTLADGREREFSTMELPRELFRMGVDPEHIEQIVALAPDEYMVVPADSKMIAQATSGMNSMAWVAAPEVKTEITPEAEELDAPDGKPWLADTFEAFEDRLSEIEAAAAQESSFNQDADSVSVTRPGRSQSYEIEFDDGRNATIGTIENLEAALQELGVPEDQIQQALALGPSGGETVTLNVGQTEVDTFDKSADPNFADPDAFRLAPEPDTFEDNQSSIVIEKNDSGDGFRITFTNGSAFPEMDAEVLNVLMHQIQVPEDQMDDVYNQAAGNGVGVEVNVDSYALLQFETANIQRIGSEHFITPREKDMTSDRGIDAAQDDGQEFTSRGLGLGQ